LRRTARAPTCDDVAVVRRVAAALGVAALVGLLAFVAKAWYDSRIPGTYNVMDYGRHDYGGGTEPAGHSEHGTAAGTRVSELHGSTDGAPDRRFQLTAKAADIQLSAGRTVHALTFNGTSPGPELRVRQGDLVEVVLRNEDVDPGVTVHWHGVDVPNAEDGVAGVTQDAVGPGESHTYRFRAEQRGTFWYHTHQISSKEVRRGLFGVIVIEPREKPPGLDLALAVHTFDGIPTLGGHDTPKPETVAAGTPVRLRLVNTDSVTQTVTVSGTAFRVLAIDGVDVHEPGELENVALPIAAGGRVDVGYVQPPHSVRVGLEGTNVARVLGPAPAPLPPEATPTSDFDALAYGGAQAATPVDARSSFDRRFELTIGRKLAFFDGRPGFQWALDGGVYPDVPVFMVDEGDLVELTIDNDTKAIHPMHLHGHHMLVLSRDGVAASGSPWWPDTLDVNPGERYVVAFRADNPGIWMDHCHNLKHAADGMVLHLAYAGVSTPFRVGDDAGNEPE
ncbi:MAG: multicopper oxidase family protein, partial [Gaiellaceae bacterium]